MLDQLKDLTARQVGKALGSDATMRILMSPQVKLAIVKAINLRAEARDVVEKSVREVATALDLVTRSDVAALKRSIRDLEDHVADLRNALDAAQQQAASARADAEAQRQRTQPTPAAPPAPRAAAAGHRNRKRQAPKT